MKRAMEAFDNRPRVKERHFVYAVLGLWFLLVFHHSFERALDRFDTEPWVSAELTVIPRAANPFPVIAYEINARRVISGEWTALILDQNGDRIATRKGRGNYSPDRNGGTWPWDDFFSNPLAPVVPPAVPDVPYRVCVFYTLTADTGVVQDTPTYCSELVTP